MLKNTPRFQKLKTELKNKAGPFFIGSKYNFKTFWLGDTGVFFRSYYKGEPPD